ncbi:MAG TPA: transcriptional regulator, partial [Acetobacteraceae bacterium]|nr:transcriptional regulator [Acetobacteraceae bacterium]
MDHAASVEMPISFGRFRLFPRQRLLLDGEKQVRLGSRALEILVTLIERPGELVRKDELIARVWPDTIVVEDNLAVHIAAVRRALGDGSGGKRYLVTVPGRGYCFVGSLTRQRAAGAPHQASPARRQPHNLPASLAPLIGRADVIRHLGDQLPRRRMLTIVGAGGIGK